MGQQDDLHIHGVFGLSVRVLSLADVLAGVRQDGFVDAVLAADHGRPSRVEDPADLGLRDSVCVAEQSQAVAVEDDQLGRALAGDDGRVDDHSERDGVVGGIQCCGSLKKYTLRNILRILEERFYVYAFFYLLNACSLIRMIFL